MPHPPRLFPSDVELGKRDDDHKPGSKSLLAALWSHHRIFLRRSSRKTVAGLVLLLVLYYFVKNMTPDLEPGASRPYYDRASVVERPGQWSNSQTTKHTEVNGNMRPGGQNEAETESKHWFNGPISFYNLASSLGDIPKNTRGSGSNVRHILFAASNVKSAAILLPWACEMAALKKNHVHFAFMGRDDISLELLKEVNGVKVGCDVWFHDSRPDALLESSDFRMEVSSSAALGHIDYYMHPQAVIIDNSGVEDSFFLKAFRNRASLLGKTLIELPRNAEQSLRWITRLDSSSLKYWNKVGIDIVIHAQPAASGSLLRLLNSLSKADYSEMVPPRLTIELPPNVEEQTKIFLTEYKWPPSHHSLDGNANQLNIRHRIPQHGLTPEENSIRFLESFWPMNSATSHLLVLSPHAELSPLYFHSLKYFILEYRHSNRRIGDSHLMGISLDLPSTYLNDTTAFSPPTKTGNGISDSGSAISFLWQAPNSNAALYFGDKWTELHSFLRYSLISQHKLPSPAALNAKYVSKTYPSWLEDILRLARTRGYYMLYSTLADKVALATIHNELYKPPEEFSGQDHDESDPPPADEVNFTADPAHHLSLQHVEKPLASTSLLSLLPSDGILPSLAELPLLGWDGKTTTMTEMEEAAANYSRVFRHEIGGCEASDKHRPGGDGSAADLFCLDDIDQK